MGVDLELWMLLGLVIVGAAIGIFARTRRSRRAAGEKEAPNIYPLW
jgi:hypothetical protein